MLEEARPGHQGGLAHSRLLGSLAGFGLGLEEVQGFKSIVRISRWAKYNRECIPVLWFHLETQLPPLPCHPDVYDRVPAILYDVQPRVRRAD